MAAKQKPKQRLFFLPNLLKNLTPSQKINQLWSTIRQTNQHTSSKERQIMILFNVKYEPLILSNLLTASKKVSEATFQKKSMMAQVNCFI